MTSGRGGEIHQEACIKVLISNLLFGPPRGSFWEAHGRLGRLFRPNVGEGPATGGAGLRFAARRSELETNAPLLDAAIGGFLGGGPPRLAAASSTFYHWVGSSNIRIQYCLISLILLDPRKEGSVTPCCNIYVSYLRDFGSGSALAWSESEMVRISWGTTPI